MSRSNNRYRPRRGDNDERGEPNAVEAPQLSNEMSAYIPGRPLVVIAGWLGCQRRSLRRYEALYEKIGFGVVTRIATPRLVVKSSTQANSRVDCPSEWPDKQQLQCIHTMQDLAWDALREVYASQSSVVLFHVFSNGGGFLWEQVSHILTDKQVDTDVATILGEIREKVMGVVFDSCPARYSPKSRNTLLDALRHCTWTERVGAYAQLAQQMAALTLEEREQRAGEYFENMRNDPWNVRQLYLFSKDDPLSPHDAIQELVRHRQQVFGKDRILRCQWDSSPHCCHLLQHPIEYQAAVTTFADQCLSNSIHSAL